MPIPEITGYCATCGEDMPPDATGRCQRCGQLLMGVLPARNSNGTTSAASPTPKPTFADEMDGFIARATSERVRLMAERERIDVQVKEIDTLIGPLVKALATARGQRPARGGPKVGTPLNGRWARDWDQCRGCGTTEIKHSSRGLCMTCQTRARKGTPLPLEVAS